MAKSHTLKLQYYNYNYNIVILTYETLPFLLFILTDPLSYNNKF
jgi:hypothetical protein